MTRWRRRGRGYPGRSRDCRGGARPIGPAGEERERLSGCGGRQVEPRGADAAEVEVRDIGGSVSHI